jgi:hypothetical protein
VKAAEYEAPARPTVIGDAMLRLAEKATVQMYKVRPPRTNATRNRIQVNLV